MLVIPGQGWEIPQGLVGEVRRVVAGARMPVDHSHAQAEFCLVLRGGGSYTLGDRTFVLKPGTLVWLLPGTHHRLMRSGNLEMWVVSLRPEAIDPDWGPTLAESPSHLVAGDELIDLDRLLSQVAQDSDEPGTYNAGITYATRRAWRATRTNPASRERQMHPAVTRALLLLREGGASESLSELANQAGVAAPYLSRLLIEHTGRSFVEWRNRIRLDRFIRAYRQDDNLLAAATAAGFGSYARFHHVFTEIMGCTPSDWTRRVAGEAPTDDVVGPLPEGPGEYGVPGATASSTRQRWLGLVSLVSPVLAEFFGAGFLDRVLDAIPDQSPRPPPRSPPDQAELSAARARLIEALRAKDPARADVLAGLLATVDFTTVHRGILNAFDLSADDIADATTGLLGLAWVAANAASDRGPGEVEALDRQVRDALGRRASDLAGATRADVDAAIEVHSIIVYYALQAARAAGDQRVVSQTGAAAAEFGRRTFGGDMLATGFDLRGLVRLNAPAPSTVVKRRAAG